MAPVFNDVFRAVAKMSQASNDIMNVYHYKLTGSGIPPSNGQVLEALNNVLNGAYDNIDGSMANNITFDEIEVYNVTQDEYVGVTSWLTLTTGGGSAAMLPPQTAALVLFATNVAKSLGKKFFPPLTTVALDDDGSPTAAVLTALGLYAADLLTGWDGSTWFLLPGNYRPLAGTFLSWLSAAVRDVFATQRRRYTGSGT